MQNPIIADTATSPITIEIDVQDTADRATGSVDIVHICQDGASVAVSPALLPALIAALERAGAGLAGSVVAAA